MHWFSELGTAQGKKEETGKTEEEGKENAKMQRITNASTQERMRLRTRSRRMTRMMARMRAKCENDGAEVSIHVVPNDIYLTKIY